MLGDLEMTQAQARVAAACSSSMRPLMPSPEKWSRLTTIPAQEPGRPSPPGELVVWEQHGAGVAEHAQVLRGIEADGGAVAEASGRLAIDTGTHRVRRVL